MDARETAKCQQQLSLGSSILVNFFSHTYFSATLKFSAVSIVIAIIRKKLAVKGCFCAACRFFTCTYIDSSENMLQGVK